MRFRMRFFLNYICMRIFLNSVKCDYVELEVYKALIHLFLHSRSTMIPIMLLLILLSTAMASECLRPGFLNLCHETNLTLCAHKCQDGKYWICFQECFFFDDMDLDFKSCDSRCPFPSPSMLSSERCLEECQYIQALRKLPIDYCPIYCSTNASSPFYGGPHHPKSQFHTEFESRGCSIPWVRSLVDNVQLLVRKFNCGRKVASVRHEISRHLAGLELLDLPTQT